MSTNSILINVRKAMGLDETDAAFDTELLIHTNSAIATLLQINVGVPIVVTDETAVWDDFKDPKANNDMFEMVKMYIFAKVKILFDPPPPSNVQYYQASIDESLWRLKIAYDNITLEGGENEDDIEFYRRSRTSWREGNEMGCSQET